MKDYFKTILYLFCFFNCLFCWSQESGDYDLTVVSSIDFNGSVRRHGIGLIDCLKNKVSMNFILTRECDLNGVNDDVQKVVLCTDKTPGDVAILEDPLWYADAMPDSPIKIAYSVFESTKIPEAWVKTLNEKFDAVVVADPFFKSVYRKCGVKIPIFHIPLGIFIDEFLQKPLKQAPAKPFVFGTCARFFIRKNHELLLKAFVQEFGRNKNVILKMNGGGVRGVEKIFTLMKKIIATSKITNVYVTNNALSWPDYVEYMSEIDCYINISQGEGFSITPREALAVGIPCIVTDNTAQKTICESGCVRVVPSNILIPLKKDRESIGNRFDCTSKDVRAALRDVYKNYDFYLTKAKEGRSWVQQYRWINLQKKYMNLVIPNKLILGDKNEVTDDYLMTNSQKLYDKYQELLNKKRRRNAI
jgi:glycosyltransferase involved in cell wall biosynthesis